MGTRCSNSKKTNKAVLYTVFSQVQVKFRFANTCKLFLWGINEDSALRLGDMYALPRLNFSVCVKLHFIGGIKLCRKHTCSIPPESNHAVSKHQAKNNLFIFHCSLFSTDFDVQPLLSVAFFHLPSHLSSLSIAPYCCALSLLLSAVCVCCCAHRHGDHCLSPQAAAREEWNTIWRHGSSGVHLSGRASPTLRL